MFQRWLGFSSLIATALLISGAVVSHAEQAPGVAAQAAPTLAIEGLGKGTAPIDGRWQFHIGDDLTWASPAVNDAAGQAGWEQLTADDPWGEQGHPAYTGIAWYRRHIHIDPAPGASPEIAMMIVRVDDAYELYLNGVLIGKNGKLPPHPSFQFPQAPQTYGLGPIRDGVLALRVWKAPLTSFDPDTMGGFYEAPIVGSPTAIASRKAELDYRWLRGRQYYFGLQSLYALVMLLSFLTWLRNHAQPVPFWMAAFAFSAVVSGFLGTMPLPISYNLGLGWMQPALGIGDIALWFLLLYLLNLNQRRGLARLTKVLAFILIVCTSLDGAITMMDWTAPWVAGWASGADAGLTAIITALEVFPLVLVAFSLRKRLDSTRWPLAITALLTGMIQVTHVTLLQGSRFTHWTFGVKLDKPLFDINGNRFTPETIAQTLLLLAIIYSVYRFQQDSNRRRIALEQEFKSARELQQILIPEELPEPSGYKLTSAYKPASEVGGDFFQIVELDGGETLVVLGDVSGKGLTAAMAVAMIVGAIRTLAESTGNPAEILAGLNRRLDGRLNGGFATCIALRLSPDGRAAMATAGHPPPFLNDREMDLPGALPLGMAPSIEYGETTIRLQLGDRLSLYTDGLLEARNPAGELYGFERLKILFAADSTAEQATQAAVRFGQEDDITVLTLTHVAAGQRLAIEYASPVLAPA
jgi:serine phosphatase RsbU (regulator of sigma subunit)